MWLTRRFRSRAFLEFSINILNGLSEKQLNLNEIRYTCTVRVNGLSVVAEQFNGDA